MARNHGKIRSRTRHGQQIFYLDFRPIGEVYSIPNPGDGNPMPFSGEEMARSALESIRDAVAEGKTLQQALAPFSDQYPGLADKLKRDISHVFLQVEAASF